MTQKKRTKLIVIIVCSILVVGMMSMSALSFAKFGTFNFPKATMALISISSGNDEYVEVKSDPNKIIIATPDNSMQVYEEYLTESGYTILEDEQLGSLIIVSQDGEKETVAFSVNKYCSVWQWVDEE
jgi:hypothetical protein